MRYQDLPDKPTDKDDDTCRQCGRSPDNCQCNQELCEWCGIPVDECECKIILCNECRKDIDHCMCFDAPMPDYCVECGKNIYHTGICKECASVKK